MNKAQFEALLEQVESSGAKLVAVSKSVDTHDVHVLRGELLAVAAE